MKWLNILGGAAALDEQTFAIHSKIEKINE
jgi:hypothetical protein